MSVLHRDAAETIARIEQELERTRAILAAAVEFDMHHDPACAKGRRCTCYLREIERETMNTTPFRPARVERAQRARRAA